MMPLNWDNPYPTIRTPVFAHNVVATSQPLAAQAGLRILQAGGNAVDAAIAAAAVLIIVEPVSCGLGGDAFAILWDGKSLHGLNASGVAPAAWTRDYFLQTHGGKIPERGWDSVTVPGVVAGWAALSEKFGRLRFGDLLQPAIRIARDGHLVSSIVQRKWAAAIPILKNQSGFSAAFMPYGRAPQTGEIFTFPDAAKTLESLAQHGGEIFYHGEIARSLSRHARDCGGQLSEADLSSYAPEWVDPLQIPFAGYTVHELPPNGQGIAALMALGMLEHFDLAALAVDSIDIQHLQIEAMKLAFADTYHWAGDARSMAQISAADLLSADYLKERAKLINIDRASYYKHGLPKAGGTIYLTVADDEGMMVSFIQSNYMGFGSGIVVPETGVSLQNRGFGFNLVPGHPNCVAPGKRPFHTIIPGFVCKDGQPQLSFGVMGGNMQPQGHVQTLVRMLVHGQQPQTACDAPRWKVGADFSIDVEKSMQPELVAGLLSRGHQLVAKHDSYMDFGAGQFIWRLDNGYVAASDARRDGIVAGWAMR